MRASFIRTLIELAERDPRILLLTADLGYTVLEPFAQRLPARFFNTGVAEQNLVGLATGLAEAGLLPFVYSIASFAVLRPYEFIRNGPAHHHLPIRIVGVGGGLEYGHDGISHHALEDVALMRLQPGITVIAPADYRQARTALLGTWDLPNPIYYRLGKDDRTEVPGLDGRFELARVQLIGEGDALLIVCLGSVAVEAAAAAEILRRQGMSCAVAVVSSFNPDPADLAGILSRYPVVLTVEAHYAVGGLGSLVADIVAEHGLSCRLIRRSVQFVTDGVTGSMAYLHRKHGLSAQDLVEAATLALSNVRQS